ncbi:putative (S)-N-methylcoclaurine 3'-hydroxylase isozyme 2 [Sesamum alatum]|uniref:(S)-N-methylcoclaurine 3'-hydroxylase isozyme 2 n=1 Tax=Sesamum alatum TaxID=300844 RepID=A0AAE2CV54_9LAMI|nr:putative (S)-N-methylcoclaurine 3'-hydroxylase isozyme 2 [Sesamum alatum]
MAEPFLDSAQTPTLLLPLLLLPLLYCIISKYFINKPNTPPLPPGPTPCPIFHLLNPITHVSLAELSQTYGPLMRLKLGTETLVVASSPAAAMEILKTNDRTFSARTVPHAVPLTVAEIERISFWGDALSDHWKNVRAICRAELFSAKSLEAQRRLWEEKAAAMVGSLRAEEGAAVDLGRVVFATVVNVFGNVLFSEDVVGVEEERRWSEVKGLLRGIIAAISAPNLGDFYPLFLGKFDPHGLRKKHRETSVRMWGLWERVVRERRRQRSAAEAELRNRDFLDVLISRGFTDHQINKLFEV